MRGRDTEEYRGRDMVIWYKWHSFPFRCPSIFQRTTDGEREREKKNKRQRALSALHDILCYHSNSNGTHMQSPMTQLQSTTQLEEHSLCLVNVVLIKHLKQIGTH